MSPYPWSQGRASTVTDNGPLTPSITSQPGWKNPPTAPYRPARSLPAASVGDLLTPDGKIHWPGTTANDIRLMPAKGDAVCAVSLVVRGHPTYGQARIRDVTDTRLKLTELARQSLPALKAGDHIAAPELERFIAELQKVLTTMAAHF